MGDLIINLSIVFLAYEVLNLILLGRLTREIEDVKSKLSDRSNLTNFQKHLVVFQLTYFIWNICGLFTPMAVYFSLLLILSIVSAKIKGELVSRDKWNKTSSRTQLIIDSMLSILILLSIIFLNNF